MIFGFEKEIFYLILLIVESIILIGLDQKIWNTYFTPITFLSVPFIIVLSGAVFLAEPLGFYPVYWKAILVWIVGLFVFWLPSLIIGGAKAKLERGRQLSCYKKPSLAKNFRFIKEISLILLFIVFFNVYQLSQNHSIGSVEFYRGMGQGLPAHCCFALWFITIYFISCLTKSSKGLWIFVILIFITSVLYGAKSWMLIPTIAGLITRFIVQNKFKISIMRIALLIASIFLVFFATYYGSVVSKMDGDMDRYTNFILNHIGRYFFAGIISFSEYLRSDAEIALNYKYIFTSPINIYNVLVGNEIIAPTSNIWNIISFEGFPSNVKTLFGTIYIYSGFKIGVPIVFLFGTIYYCILVISIFKKSLMIISIYAFMVSILIFGWFEMYFQLLAFYEVPVVGSLIYLCTKKQIKLYTHDS